MLTPTNKQPTTNNNNNTTSNNNQHEQQNIDEQQQKLSLLKKQVSLSKSQLLELAYDDQKFVNKLQELNNHGYEAMTEEENFSQALVYLTQAENILQYAASCGKTIDRNLIIGTLQNQACVYHRMWELQKSINYIEAIIYNITSFLDNEQGIDFKLPALQQHTQENIKTSIYLKNKLHLVFYYLQFCAVSSQNQSHQTALSAASKALNIIKEICQQEYNLQRVARKNGVFYTSDEDHLQMLLELYNIKDCYDSYNGSNQNFQQKQSQQQPIEKTIEKFILKAKKTNQRFKSKLPQRKQRYPKICSQLEHYSIGYVMQINPTKLQKKPQLLDLKQQLQYINKIYKAIYISICHFTMATQLRLMSGQKFPIDPQMRRASYEFKSSQLHHLIAIITAGLYIPCETVYYEHILNSFRNHYSIDLSQKDSQISLTSQNYWNDEDDDLIHLQTSSLNLKKDTNQSMDSNEVLSSTKLKNSEHNVSKGSPQLYSKMKKGMSKNKLTTNNRQSQKSLKKSGHQQQTQRMKSKSKQKQKQKLKSNTKKSNLKQSSKSRKKSSRKIQQKIKSPSIHKKPQINNILKKASEMKQKKNSDMKIPTSRSKTKSRKKMSRSKHQLDESKQKVPLTKSNLNFIPTPSSSKKLLPPSLNSLRSLEKQKVQKFPTATTITQRHQKSQKYQKNNIFPIKKTLSSNVYIQQRSNNQLNKDKISMMKKQANGINSMTNSMTNSEAVSQKLITLKKNKSPSSALNCNVADKQSRSAKKGMK